MNRVIVPLAVGVIVGSLTWAAVGRLNRPQSPTEDANINPGSDAAGGAIADALAMPIFGVSQPPLSQAASPTAVPATDLRLVGISYSSRRRAALISWGSGPAVWLSTGQTKDDVTVSQIGPDGVILQIGGVAKRLALQPQGWTATHDLLQKGKLVGKAIMHACTNTRTNTHP